MPKLTKTELMALDLAIEAMKDEQINIDADPEAFIGKVVAVTKKVVNVTKKATPVVKVAVQVTPAVLGKSVAGSAIKANEETDEQQLESISLDALIALRNSLTSDESR